MVAVLKLIKLLSNVLHYKLDNIFVLISFLKKAVIQAFHF